MANTIQDWVAHRDAPRAPRPRPPPTPTPEPLRCRRCREEVFPGGRLRLCRCDRRSIASVVAIFALPALVILGSLVVTLMGAR